MKLSGRGRRGAWGFDHYFSKRIPPALKDENRKAFLVLQLRLEPTTAIKDELILGHIALGCQIVGTYLEALRGRQHLDLLTSEMAFAVTTAVNDFPTRCEHDNITGYIVECIHSKISKSLEDLPAVRVPGATQRKRKERGKDYLPAIGLVDANNSIIQKGIYKEDTNLQQPEVDELMLKISINEQEREVLRLRLEGLSDMDVGTQLGLHRTTVHAIRKGIQSRYKELTS